MGLVADLISRRQFYLHYPVFCGPVESSNSYEDAAIVIIPVPYDRSSSYHRGADLGPEALLRASEYLEFYDIETAFELCPLGVFTLPPPMSVVTDEGPQRLSELLQVLVAEVIRDGKFPVVIGGNHSVSIGPARAAYEAYPELNVLQLDAHADTRDEYLGSRYNHACVMARIREHSPVVQVGIRSIDASEAEGLSPKRTFFAHEIHSSKAEEWIDRVDRVLGEKIYITFDLDCFDPSLLPSTGTPEPGGLFWHQVMPLLRTVVERRQVVGLDVVELLPRPEAPASDFVAAKLLYQTLSYIFAARGGRDD